MQYSPIGNSQHSSGHEAIFSPLAWKEYIGKCDNHAMVMVLRSGKDPFLEHIHGTHSLPCAKEGVKLGSQEADLLDLAPDEMESEPGWEEGPAPLTLQCRMKDARNWG